MERRVEIDSWPGFSDALSSVRAVLEEAHLSGTGHRLGAAASPQLAVEVVYVGLYGGHRDEEPARDLLVGHAGGDERQHLQLALAQGFGEPLGGGGRRRILSREGRQELGKVADRDAGRGVEA